MSSGIVPERGVDFKVGSRLSRRRFLRLSAAAGLLTGFEARWLAAAIEKRSVTGRVYGGEEPLQGVRVSDGLQVVSTDAQGRFEIEVSADSGRFLFVTTPPGFWTNLFHVPTAKAAAEGKAEFRLVPRPQSARFRFVFWTDVHLEGGGVRVEKFRRTVQEVNALEPAFVWGQGDICLEGNAGKDYLECVAALKAPIRNGAGNHELIVKAQNPWELFDGLFGPDSYSFDWAGVHCVVLDGKRVASKVESWTSVHGLVSDRELAWLKADLAAKPKDMPVIAGIHIPLFTSFLDRREVTAEGAAPWTVANASRVHEILRAYDGRLVLQGHLHENERILRDGVEYATTVAAAGSWWGSGAGFERGVDRSPRGYRVIEVDGTTIRHRYLSSAESHVEAPGDFGKLREEYRPSRKTRFVFNGYDLPSDAERTRVRGRLDDGAWQEMPAYPAVNPRGGNIFPHHFLLEVDSSAAAPGRHRIAVEAAIAGGGPLADETFRHQAELTVGDPSRKVPVLYSTDLYHPHDDPDDHFDLAALFAIPEIDLRAVILDDGAKQKERPGMVAVRQLMAITGREVPVATGLAPKLGSLRDTGGDQPREFQGGVELILKALRESKDPVVVAAVGSLRDVAAAFNREPDLCAEKIERILAFIGDAHSAPGFDFREYNVTLDVNAYRAVLQSGLSVFWVPCFDGGPWKNGGRASFWQARHSDLLATVKDPVKQYFIYALLKKTQTDPLAFLNQPVDEGEWKQVLAMERNLWCCAVFLSIPERRIVRRDGSWRSLPLGRSDPGEPAEPFSFERVLLRVDPTGMVVYPDRLPRYSVDRFRVTELESYARAMTALTAELLAGLG